MKDRILYLITMLCNGSNLEFSQKTGINNATLSNLKKENEAPINPNKGNGSNKELVRELYELFMKYRINMQLSDIGKMDNIFDQLRKNNY